MKLQYFQREDYETERRFPWRRFFSNGAVLRLGEDYSLAEDNEVKELARRAARHFGYILKFRRRVGQVYIKEGEYVGKDRTRT